METMSIGGRLVLAHEFVDRRNGMCELDRLEIDVGHLDGTHRGIDGHLETTLVERAELPTRAHVELEVKCLAKLPELLDVVQPPTSDIANVLGTADGHERSVLRRPSASTKCCVDDGHQVIHDGKFASAPSVLVGIRARYCKSLKPSA